MGFISPWENGVVGGYFLKRSFSFFNASSFPCGEKVAPSLKTK
jgi:hypothetical protein